MKPIYLVFLVLPVLLFCMCMRGSAQSAQRANDSLFKLVKTAVNAQDGDALYALLNDNFKANISKDQFTGILKANLYPMGTIKETSLISYADGQSKYKAACATETLEFRISADKEGKIAGLRFLPYKEPVGTKNHVVPTNNPMQSTIDSAVDHIARSYIDKVNTVGLSIGIVKSGTAGVYGYGATTKSSGVIPDADAIFEIGSISKTFTATLLAYYVGEHKVSLNDPVTKYLPDDIAANKELQKVTLQMLANHTSGLPRLPDNLLNAFTDMSNPYKSYNLEKLYKYLKNCKLQSVPGEKYAYSNLGAGLLGTILAEVSGKTYEQMITDIICTPLGMSSTSTRATGTLAERYVAVHNDKGEQVPMWDMNVLAGAGAIRSTVHDMVLYVRANMQQQSGKLPQAMELTHKITYDKEMAVGLGWHIVKEPTPVYWHNGGTGGCSSIVLFDPQKQIAVVVLSNAAESADAVGQEILKVLQRD